MPRILVAAAAAALAVGASAPPAAHAAELPEMTLGFYAQPQFKLRQNSPVQGDEDGFILRRTRVLLGAERTVGSGLTLRFVGELEVLPDFSAQDAYFMLAGDLAQQGGWSLQLGQFKAPYSRSTLMSDSRLMFVEKPALAGSTGLAPDRQIGFAGHLVVPVVPWIQVSAGIFNGEGRNILANTDENFMFAGRIAFRPLGAKAALAESAFGEDEVGVAANIAYNTRDQGDYDQSKLYYGFDGWFVWNGISGSFEYLTIDTTYSEGAPETEFFANGLAGQVGYLLPLPGTLHRRIEVAARFEEIDRNDTVPIPQPGLDEQSLRFYTLAASYYHQQHGLKVQLQASHITEVEDETSTGGDATFDNDTVLLQVTFRQ